MRRDWLYTKNRSGAQLQQDSQSAVMYAFGGIPSATNKDALSVDLILAESVAIDERVHLADAEGSGRRIGSIR